MNSGQVDWKRKYLEIRRNMINAMNMAFRDGYEQGANDTQMQNMQMQQAQMQQQMAQQQASMMGGDGQPGGDGGLDAGGPPQEDGSDVPQDDGSGGNPPPPGQDVGVPMANSAPNMSAVAPQGEELDQYLGELEQIVSKSENPDPSLLKSLEKIKLFQANTKMVRAMNLRKAEKKQQPKALIPRVLPKRTAANLSPNSKAALSMQQSIVDGIMQKWEREASNATSEVMQIVGTEALTKKE